MALAREHRRHAHAPGLLDRVQDAQLVVDQDVVPRRKEPLDVVQFVFFVHVDQHAVFHRAPQARALHLSRLEHRIAIRQDDRRAPLGDTADGVQSAGIQPIGERVVGQPACHAQHAGIVQCFDAIALQRPQVVSVAEFPAQFLE